MSIIPTERQAEYERVYGDARGQLWKKVRALRETIDKHDKESVTVILVTELVTKLLTEGPVASMDLGTMLAVALIELATTNTAPVA